MFEFNILKRLYKHTPMNFYAYSQDGIIIRSINNTFLGYKYDKGFTHEEINNIWNHIKSFKRISTIFMFVFFIFVLYGIIFPYYYFLIDLKWYYTVLPFLVIIILVYQGITFLNTKLFEKELKKNFGNYERVSFPVDSEIDNKYYHIYKTELLKAFALVFFILLCFKLISPFKISLNLIHDGKYSDVIKLTTIGSKIFPIAPEWYALRGYSNFKLKNYNNAIKDYDKAYRLDPTNYNVMNFDNKIYIKYYIKDYKSALKDFDYEIEHAADDYDKDTFMWDKAQFLYNIKRYDEAVKLYDELIIKSENDKACLLSNRLYFERAQVYKQLGKSDLAEKDITNAEDLSLEDTFKNPIPQPTLLLDEM